MALDRRGPYAAGRGEADLNYHPARGRPWSNAPTLRVIFAHMPPTKHPFANQLKIILILLGIGAVWLILRYAIQ